MNYDRKALKLESKALIRSVRPKAWVVTLVLVLLAVVLPQLVKGFLNPMWELMPEFLEDMADMVGRGREPDEVWIITMAGRIISSSVVVLFLSVLTGLFAIVMNYGYRGYAIRVFLRQKAGVGDLFTGFPLAGRIIGTAIMVVIFTFLWNLLINLVASLALELGLWLFETALSSARLAEALGVALSVVLSVARFVLGWLVSLRYCLAPYFVMSAEMGVFEAITASKQTMRGHYGKKLVLELSFLGWGLLVMLIIYAVVFLGAVVVLLTAGAPWLLELEEASHYVVTDQQAAVLLLHSLADLVRDLMTPMVAVLAVAWLVALPLNLWLRAYETVAEAGFFLTVTGQVRVVSDEEELAAVAVPVPAPVFDEAEVQEPEAPAAAEVPEPEIPEFPEAPEPETAEFSEAPETETAEPETPEE